MSLCTGTSTSRYGGWCVCRRVVSDACHCVQVFGRVVTVAGVYVDVWSVKRVAVYRFLDESLRWLVANGRKEAVVRVLERAARVNRKDLSTVLKTLQDSDVDSPHTSGSHTRTVTRTEPERT